MTSYSYHLDLSESEAITLEAVLDSYSAICREKVLAGEDGSFFKAREKFILDILKKLRDGRTLRSWNNFSQQ